LNLFCGDGAGHILIEVEIRDDGFVARQLTAKARFVLDWLPCWGHRYFSSAVEMAGREWMWRRSHSGT
jgi:hypothetical protein